MTAGPYLVEDFEDDTLLPGVAFSSATGVSRFPAALATGGVTPSGDTGLVTDDFPDAITVSFAAPITSAGLAFGNDDPCCSDGFVASLDVFADGMLLGTVSVDANMNNFADQWLGFISDVPANRMVLRFGTGDDVDLFPYIDDVTFNTAETTSIPLPAAVPLTAFGLAALGLLARRSRP